uniref:Uncharacterized protein n=1 Tax=Varanus komodoensis TaxID=61221 RepID=A0A8D2KTE7_VARKO
MTHKRGVVLQKIRRLPGRGGTCTAGPALSARSRVPVGAALRGPLRGLHGPQASLGPRASLHTTDAWPSPSSLRSKDIELSGFNGTAAFMEVRIQSIVVEFILTHVEQIFRNAPLRGESSWALSGAGLPPPAPPRPPQLSDLLGDGPPQIRPYHTIIELADSKRKGSIKAKKWKSIFNLGRSSNDSRRKSHKPEDKGERLTVPQRPAPLVQGASRSTGSHAPRTKAGTWDHSLHSSPPRCSPSRNICAPRAAQGPDSDGFWAPARQPRRLPSARAGWSCRAECLAVAHPVALRYPGWFACSHSFSPTGLLSNRGVGVGAQRHLAALETPALMHLLLAGSGPQPISLVGQHPSAEEDSSSLAWILPGALEWLTQRRGPRSSTGLDENQPCKGSDVGPESVDCSVGSLSLMDDDMGSGFMNELIGDGMQVSPMATPQVAEPQFQFVRRFVGKGSHLNLRCSIARSPRIPAVTSSGAAPPDAPSPDSCIDPISMAAASPDSRPESLLQKPRHAPPTDQRDALRHGLCDGSVHMRLTSSSIKVQHVKSFPVVPPKPQFAKIPPALTPRAPAREASTPGASPPPAQDCRKKTENGLDKGSLHKPLRPVSLDAPWGPASVSASTDPLLAAPEPWAPSRNCCGDGGALLKQRNSMPVSLEHYGPDCESGRDAAQSPHISLLDGCSFWPQGGPRGRDGHLPVKFSLPERSSNMHSAGQDGRGEPSTPQLPPAALPEKGVGEAGGAAPQKQRWVSWRNGGSMSFDEAVALAKERHVAQAPVRRMQTYCYGDSEALPGPPGTERPPAQPKPALRLLGQRPLRPLSCLAVAEGPASGKPLAAQAPAETSPDGRRPPSQEEPSIPADPQPRSRTGLSRVGRCPAMTEESSHSSPQERR